MICPKNMNFKSCTPYEWVEACQEATLNIPLLWTLCVSEMSTVQSGHCYASGWYNLASYCKSAASEIAFFEQIIVNLSQFRVSCYKFDVKLKLWNFSKALCNYNTPLFISKLLAPKLVRISFCFFCGVYRLLSYSWVWQCTFRHNLWLPDVVTPRVQSAPAPPSGYAPVYCPLRS